MHNFMFILMTNETISQPIAPESLYSAFFEALPGKSILVRAIPPSFTILAATTEYRIHSGYKDKILVGKGVFEAFPANESDPGDTGQKDLSASFHQVLRHKKPHSLPLQRYDLRTEDGRFVEKYWKVSNHPVLSPSGEVIFIIHTADDITEQVQAGRLQDHLVEMERTEKLLQTALEQARLSKEAAELGTFDMDLEKGTMHWDDRCRILFGISHQSTVSYEKDFVTGLHPDDRLRITELINELFTNPKTKGNYDVEYRTVGAEDHILRWVRAKGRVYYNETGKPVRFIGSVLDITEKVLARQKIEALVEERTEELARAYQTLQHINTELERSNQKLEEFAHAASHDLKEPMRKIQFFTQRLKDQLSPQLKDEQHQTFDRINVATERMRQLVDDLLSYSHVSLRPPEMESVDLNKKVHLALEDLELDIAEKKAVIHIGALPTVKGYRRQLQQLFQNLIGNALKYNKPGVAPHIDITATEETDGNTRYHLISIKDNGIGFEQQYSDKIFQMFTRLHGKTTYSGTGVGLSIVKKIVENHGGHMKATSTPNEGATFLVYLPHQMNAASQ